VVSGCRGSVTQGVAALCHRSAEAERGSAKKAVSLNCSTRRNFLRAAAGAAVFAWHAGLRSKMLPPGNPHKDEQQGRFTLIRLHATRLEEMRRFYNTVLDLPVHGETKDSLSIRFGSTLIEFAQRDGNDAPFYHFAFNVPENKFAAAKKWLAKRCPLLRDSETGADEQFFEQWNAHAVYFQDPSGNIGELIARHTLPSAAKGDFGADDILYASEIGLVSADPNLLVEIIAREFGLKPYPSPFFMGDERGMFVLPPVGRPWIPECRQHAAVFPVEVELAGHGGKELCPPDLPYVIRGKS
jgi:catechol 2,3-dioxygenase-like lactoylglutathione lyase family enzyme